MPIRPNRRPRTSLLPPELILTGSQLQRFRRVALKPQQVTDNNHMARAGTGRNSVNPSTTPNIAAISSGAYRSSINP